MLPQSRAGLLWIMFLSCDEMWSGLLKIATQRILSYDMCTDWGCQEKQIRMGRAALGKSLLYWGWKLIRTLLGRKKKHELKSDFLLVVWDLRFQLHDKDSVVHSWGRHAGKRKIAPERDGVTKKPVESYLSTAENATSSMTLRISQSCMPLQPSFKMSHAQGAAGQPFICSCRSRISSSDKILKFTQVTSPLGHTAELSAAMKETKSCLYSEGHRGSIQLTNRSSRHPLKDDLLEARNSLRKTAWA